MEIWKDIPNYEGVYKVSNLGRVKSLVRKSYGAVRGGRKTVKTLKSRILTQIDNKGYKQVCLYKEGKMNTFKVHQLVAYSFLNHKPSGMKTIIDHINGVKDDNRVENLQLITQRRNISKEKIGNTSIYTGVSKCGSTKLWKCTIGLGKTVIFIGNFDIELEAAYYYQKSLNLIHKYNGNNEDFRKEVFKNY